MENKNTLVVGIIVGIVMGFVGGRYYPFGGGILIGSGSVAELETKIEKAKKFFPSIPDMRFVSGTVEEVKSGSFIIKAFSLPNPFEDLPEKREVVVTSMTKIIRMTQKDSKVFQKEVEVAQKEQSGRKVGEVPSLASFPTPFIEKEILLKDIKVGNQVSVEAGENIKEKIKFDATRIMVQESIGGAPSQVGASALPPPPAP